MPLTPIDIQQKTFGPELRGYNMDEVDDFLDEVVGALKDYDQRVRDAQDRIRALEAELSTRGEDESAISRALVAAQKQADNLVVEARAEAERIQGDAHGEADKLRSERDAERMALTQDIARMRATVADLKRRVFELASSVDADLEDMDAAAASASQELESEEPSGDDEYDSAGVGEGLDPFDTGRQAVLGSAEETVQDAGDAYIEEELDEVDELEAEDAQPDPSHLASDPGEVEVDLDEDSHEAAARRPWERGSV